MKKTILIVEDDEVHGQLLAEIIRQETAYQAIVASDAIATLKFIQHIKPHLLILDYWLPRMNGLTLHDQLQQMEELRNVPVLLISAALPASCEIEKRNMESLKKPFELNDFLVAIDRLLQ